jgi:WD40 repeat protein
MESEYKLDYPIYAAESFTLNKKNYLLTVGGGGPAGYGVKNTVEVLEINSSKNRPKDVPAVTSVAKYDKLEDQILNVHYHNQMVALGEGSRCRFFRLAEKSNSKYQSDVKKRGKSESNDDTKTLDLEDYGGIDSHVATEGHEDPAMVYQSCTWMVPGPGGDVITGGTDNKINILTIGEGKDRARLKYSIDNAHTKDIVEVTQQGPLLCSLGRDGSANIWELSSLGYTKMWSLQEQFKFENELKEPYKFIAAKFFDHGKADRPVLLITCSVPVLSKTKGSSYVTIWQHDGKGADGKFRIYSNRCIGQDVGGLKISTRSLDVDTKSRLLSIGFTNGEILVLCVPSLEPYFKHIPKKNQMNVTKVCLASDSNDQPVVISSDVENCLRVYPLDNNYDGPSNKLIKIFILITVLIIARVVFVFLTYEPSIASETTTTESILHSFSNDLPNSIDEIKTEL